jgi:hypothetical protein
MNNENFQRNMPQTIGICIREIAQQLFGRNFMLDASGKAYFTFYLNPLDRQLTQFNVR